MLFNLRFRENLLGINIGKKGITVQNIEGSPTEIICNSKPYAISAAGEIFIP
jgi:hypothetical protein